VSQVVELEGSILHGLKLISLSALSNISIIVADHFLEESLGLVSDSSLHAAVLDNVDDGNALVVELLLDLLLVRSEARVEFGILGVLLDCGDSANSSSLGANLVLEPNREEVSLLGGEIFVLGLDNLLEVKDHIVKSLSLLGNTCHENVFF